MAVVFAVLALCGCVAAPTPPGGPSEAELDARVRAMLDHEWANTGLEGVVARPVVEAQSLGEIWVPERFECVSEEGLSAWGYNLDGLAIEGRDPTAEEQLRFYTCAARYPVVEMLSTAQLDYIYDYYARWLIPCLGREGHAVTSPPPRASFVSAGSDEGWRWNPYVALKEYPRAEPAITALHAQCPPTLPGIDGWSETHF